MRKLRKTIGYLLVSTPIWVILYVIGWLLMWDREAIIWLLCVILAGVVTVVVTGVLWGVGLSLLDD